ncbi:MAG: hypothetical protein HQL64_11650 [Magnetococcales bacterium]|nr:hypothetical protein [Magnetococcales bacterium]
MPENRTVPIFELPPHPFIETGPCQTDTLGNLKEVVLFLGEYCRLASHDQHVSPSENYLLGMMRVLWGVHTALGHVAVSLHAAKQERVSQSATPPHSG